MDMTGIMKQVENKLSFARAKIYIKDPMWAHLI